MSLQLFELWCDAATHDFMATHFAVKTRAKQPEQCNAKNDAKKPAKKPRRPRRAASLSTPSKEERGVLLALFDASTRSFAARCMKAPSTTDETLIGSTLASTGMQHLNDVLSNRSIAPGQDGHPTVYASKTYCGCAQTFRHRQWQHACSTMKVVLGLIKSSEAAALTVYKRAKLDNDYTRATKSVPFYSTTAECKFDAENHFIKRGHWKDNVARGLVSPLGYTTKQEHKRGLRQKLRQEKRPLPPRNNEKHRNLEMSRPQSVTTCTQDGTTFTSLTKAAKCWTAGTTATIMPGRFNHTSWSEFHAVYRGSTFKVGDDNTTYHTIRALKKMCSPPMHALHSAQAFTIKIVSLQTTTATLTSPREVRRVTTALQSLDKAQQHHELLRLQTAGTHIRNAHTRACTLNNIKKIARELKHNLMRQHYRMSLRFHHHLNSRSIHRAIAKIIDSRDLPRDVKETLRERTRPALQRSVRNKVPPYINAKQWIKTFNKTPWPCSNRCMSATADVPRKPSKSNNNNTKNTKKECICFNPLQYPAITDECPPLGTLLLRHKPGHGLFQGCPLSVVESAATATQSECTANDDDDVRKLVRGARIVDDKMTQVLLGGDSAVTQRADAALKKLAASYNPALKLGVEPPLRVAPTMHKFIGNILVKTGPLHWSIVHYAKNILHMLKEDTTYTLKTKTPSGQTEYRQLYRTELHHDSYQPRSSLRSQRLNRILATEKATDPEWKVLILSCKFFEYTTMLGDSFAYATRLFKDAKHSSDFPDCYDKFLSTLKALEPDRLIPMSDDTAPYCG